MLYMNDYDLGQAVSRFTRANCPNRLALALVVDNLRHWVNANSDGWAYWTKPRQAARRAMIEIQSTTSEANRLQERDDITDEEMRAAVRPIRSFLTRYGVPADEREIILRAANLRPTS